MVLIYREGKNKTEMTKKTITVLLTDVSHPVTPRAVEILKGNLDYSVTVIGVDSMGSNIGSLWVDKFFSLPKPESSNYIKKLLEICLAQKVDVVVPWTNLEALVISKNTRKFQSKNIKIVCNDFEITKTLVDKGLFYKSLEGSNILVPRYQLVSNIDELEKAIGQLGYPKNKIVVKPRGLSGGRDLFVLSAKSNIDLRDTNHNLPKNALLEMVRSSGRKNDLNYMVMEYLGGDDYSVDTLCSKGNPIFIVQRKRLADLGGVSSVGETVYDQKVYDTVKSIIDFFKIDFNCNIQLKYKTGQVGSPYVYDINPRISGTIVANAHAGIDMLTLGIYQALNIPFPKDQRKEYQHLKMVRYWSEKYRIMSGEWYSA